jgi:hypothetical protein
MNLTPWGNFYAIVGSSAGALIGLQFVVITLVANMSSRVEKATINAFGTPTVVHFGSALLLSAIFCAPWSSSVAVSYLVTTGGVGGVVYSLVVFRRAAHQSGYKPVAEDWICYVIIPAALYVVLAVAGVMLHASEELGLFLIGGGALGLLLIGVRNAWDTVVHIVDNTDKPASKQD